MLDQLSRSYAQQGESFLLDTTDFINKVKDINVPWEECLLTNMDVSGLFTNIPMADGIEMA